MVLIADLPGRRRCVRSACRLVPLSNLRASPFGTICRTVWLRLRLCYPFVSGRKLICARFPFL